MVNNSKEKYHHLFTGPSVEVLSIISLLDELKIKPVIKDQGESARLAGFGNTTPLIQEIYLHEDEIEKKKLEEAFKIEKQKQDNSNAGSVEESILKKIGK